MYYNDNAVGIVNHTSVDNQALIDLIQRSATSIVIPSGTTSIGIQAFNSCYSLSNVNIPDSVTSIGHSAFYNCRSLTSVAIPSGVTNIGRYAFGDCSGLASVTVNATTPPTAGSNLFQNTPIASGTGYIYVPDVDAYKQASGWDTYATQIMAIPNS